MIYPRIQWPEGKKFAFTVFDDTDYATLENTKPVYDLLAELGFRTTKSAWPLRCREDGETEDFGSTCENPAYLAWVHALQAQGFEIGYHLASSHTTPREHTQAALERFRQLFGPSPFTMSNHGLNRECIYWGADRLTGPRRWFYYSYQMLKLSGPTRGHIPGDRLFWGDLCHQYILYVRNFIVPDINTLKCCPMMPYHDPTKPYVRWWYASSEGARLSSYNATLAEANQDQLVEEGGACIMYTHFSYDFFVDGRLDPRFESLMRRLARQGGWFVPVRTLLDYIVSVLGEHTLTAEERAGLEWDWLRHKRRFGPS
jgi:hypothetical protein